MVNSLAGRYKITQRLGEGGFGKTFLAEDILLPGSPICVVKQLQPQENDPNFLEIARRLFKTEAEILQKLGQHNSIPQLLAYFEENQQFYLVQEYIQGRELSQDLKPGQKWTENQVVNLLKDILTTLTFVHENQVIHRDLKPANLIRRNRDGKVVLIDFGAVKAIASKTSKTSRHTQLSRTIGIGTPGYMPNEQSNGRPKLSSDVYALGIIAIQALTGLDPHPDLGQFNYDTQTDEIIWRNQVQVNPKLAEIIDKMVKQSFLNRYPSAKEALQAIDYFLQPRVIQPPSTVYSNQPQSGTQNTQHSNVNKPPSNKSELIVSPFGQADYPSISEAIKNAQNGTRILVRSGVYNEGIVIDKTLEIIGDGARDRIIIQSSDFDCILMQTDYAVVKNFTLRGRAGRKGKNFYGVNIPKGNLIVENCDITSDSWACIAIHGSSANPIIENCQIHDGKQNGVWVYDKGEGTIENCEIFANAYPGIAIQQGGNPLVKNCQIHDGKDCGIYVYEKGEGTIENCHIFANAHPGVTIKQGGNPLVKNCKVYDGKQNGVHVFDNGKGTIENCDIFANTYPGVAIKQAGNPLVKNCQIYDGKDSGIFVLENGKGTIENCNIFANAHRGVLIMQGGDPVVENCKINRNQGFAVEASENAKGTVKNCDLTNNDRGAWNIDDSSIVTRRNNITD